MLYPIHLPNTKITNFLQTHTIRTINIDDYAARVPERCLGTLCAMMNRNVPGRSQRGRPRHADH